MVAAMTAVRKSGKTRDYSLAEACGVLWARFGGHPLPNIAQPVVDPAPGHGLQDRDDIHWITIGEGDTDVPVDILQTDLNPDSIDYVISLGPDRNLNAWLTEVCRVSKNAAVLLPVTTLTSKGRWDLLAAETPEVVIFGENSKWAWFLFGDWREPGRWSLV